MAREGRYTPDEDAIILATPEGEDARRRLVAAGFPERSVNAIKQRRHYLRNVKMGLVADDASLAPEDRLTRAIARRAQLTARYENLLAEQEQVKEDLLKCVEEIHLLMDEVNSALEEEARHLTVREPA